MTASELCDLRQTALDVQHGRTSAERLTRECLARIEALEPLNAFLHVDPEAALEAARQVDQRRERGEAL